MALTGGCYCGEVRYEAEGEPISRGQCTCVECQKIAGGGPNFFMLMPAGGFRYTKGAPQTFARPDLPNPVKRDFCPTCGTHMLARIPDPSLVVVKVGSMDDPAAFGAAQVAIWTCEALPFHHIPEGAAAFERFPG